MFFCRDSDKKSNFRILVITIKTVKKAEKTFLLFLRMESFFRWIRVIESFLPDSLFTVRPLGSKKMKKCRKYWKVFVSKILKRTCKGCFFFLRMESFLSLDTLKFITILYDSNLIAILAQVILLKQIRVTTGTLKLLLIYCFTFLPSKQTQTQHLQITKVRSFWHISFFSKMLLFTLIQISLNFIFKVVF